MARTANVFARVEPDIKTQAEGILNQLGIPMSNAVDMFLRQVIIQQGLPFNVKLHAEKPLALGALSREQLEAELMKGLDDIKHDRVYSAKDVAEEMARLYGK